MMTILSTAVESTLSLAQSLRIGAGGGAGAGAGGASGATEALWLVSPWKPILAAIVFFAWAWVVASIYDKDAARWYLKRRAWNLAHVGAAVLALAALLLSPSFWIGWPVMIVVLGADLAAYAVMRNRDDRVPAAHKWSFDLEKMREGRKAREDAKLRKHVSLEFRGPGGLVARPQRETPEYEVRILAETILTDALEGRASRIEMQPAADGASYAVAFLVDGVRQMRDPLPAAQGVAVIDFFKKSAGLDVADRRRKLRAELAVEQAGGRRKLRVVSSGGSTGVRMTLLIDPDSQVRFTLDELGLLEGQRKELDALVKEQQGTVLVAAPPLSGRTSTLYALLRAHDAYTSNVQTLEHEPQDTIEGVRHNTFNPMADGAEYSTTVRSILRRDPDVVAVAELPDANTALEITRADHERTRTYVGLPADNALVAIQTFMKAVGDNAASAKALHGVVAERLVRKLCPNCRVEYQPSADLLKKLGVTPDKVQKLYKKGGQVLIKNKPEICPVCKGAGYFGQEGVFEVFQLGPEERKLIGAGDLAGLRSALRRKRLPSIQETALHKAVLGVTSVEEVARVTSPPPAKPGAGGAPARASSGPSAPKPAAGVVNKPGA